MPTFTKKSRPSFSAPKAPIPPDADDLVKNEEPEKPDPVETEVIENDLPQKEDKPDVEAPKDPQKAPTPPAKMVSRTKDEDMESPLEATLKEVKTVPAQEPVESQDEALEPDAEPEEKPEPTKDKDQADEKELMKPITKEQPKSEPPPKKSKGAGGSGFFSTLIVIFALILSASGWVMYFKEKGGINFSLDFFSSQAPEPTPTPSLEAPEPTPTPDVRGDIYLDVLNGSGVAGAAGRTADTLRALGYQIAEVGNADNSNYAETEIYAAADFDNETLLISDLLDAFDTATISGLLDEDESTASARIIVGKNWEE